MGIYIGEVPGIPRLGIPPINMHDGAQGFRTWNMFVRGLVTAWPSSLAIAATWDRQLTFEYARAIGIEFGERGANLIYGPSLNVHRVANGGRNVEYLSGESPFLGAQLAPEYVRGVQSVGVAACIKHFVLNNQELNRQTESSDADDRTLWEVYYPPFEAAVRAGAASVMCSYNRIKGDFACGGSDRLLIEDLRIRMGFKGFVVSDWGAAHGSQTALHGVDQMLPANNAFNPGSLEQVHADVDAMAARVLTGMFSANAFETAFKPPRPLCSERVSCRERMASPPKHAVAHAALARSIGAASVVLLKNEANTLPITRAGVSVLLIGSACAAEPVSEEGDGWSGDMFAVGGSGRVLSPPGSLSIQRAMKVALEQRDDGSSVTFIAQLGVSQALLKTMRNHDVAIVCAGASTGEGGDRGTLALDRSAEVEYLAAAAAAERLRDDSFPPLVVAAFAPGAITAGWARAAQAALVMFTGGQEAAGAVVDVLLGAVNPSAKVPVTFPLHAHDMTSSTGNLTVSYTERLSVAWRRVHDKPVAFPFGHGLSFTRFNLSWTTPPPLHVHDAKTTDATAEAIALRVDLRNVGGLAGAQVVQLYLSFPSSAGEPPLVLAGFEKTRTLPPGEQQTLTFSISGRSLSTWVGDADGGRQPWQRVHGSFDASVGVSSRERSLAHTFMSSRMN